MSTVVDISVLMVIMLDQRLNHHRINVFFHGITVQKASCHLVSSLVPQDVQRQTAVTAYLLLFAFELQSYDDWCPVISDLDYFGRQSMISDGVR